MRLLLRSLAHGLGYIAACGLRAGSRDVEEYLLELGLISWIPLRGLRPISNRNLEEAELLYEKGDLPRGEVLGRVAALQNAIAERRGWEHFSRRDFIIGLLCEELGYADVVRRFRMAEGLRANFYHNFMDGKIFDLHRADVFVLIERLRRCLGQRGRPA